MALLLVPCLNPDCDNLTSVRTFGATHEEPGYESTDVCDECDDNLDFENAEPDDGFDDPRL